MFLDITEPQIVVITLLSVTGFVTTIITTHWTSVPQEDIGLLEKVPQDLFHSVYFEYEENSTHDRLLSLNYAFCLIKRLIKTSEPVYTD